METSSTTARVTGRNTLPSSITKPANDKNVTTEQQQNREGRKKDVQLYRKQRHK